MISSSSSCSGRIRSDSCIKNDLVYNILPLCQYWSWQCTCPGLPSMVWTHPVCKPACQLVQDCPIQFDLLQHLMSNHGYLSVREYKQTIQKCSTEYLTYIQHKDCDMKDTEYFLVICHLIKTYRAESGVSEWWRMVDEQFQNAATWPSLSIY